MVPGPEVGPCNLLDDRELPERAGVDEFIANPEIGVMLKKLEATHRENPTSLVSQ
jgi:hypothetical protein